MAQAYIGKGNALRMQGLCEEAAETIMKGIEIEPNRPDAWYNLSACLAAADRHMEVLEAGWRALQIDPSFAPAYTAVGSALRNIRPHEVALKFYEMALAHDAENIDALKHIAAEYDIESRLEQALDAHLRVLEVDPADSLSPSRVVDITLALCDWRHYDSFSANLLDATQRQIAGGRAVTADITNLLALPVTNELTFAAARNKAAHIERGQKSVKTRPFTFSRRARDKIRIAYLLPYTWFHSMPLVLKQVVERHDRDRFSVRGYSIHTTRETADKSGFDHSFRPAFDVFRDSPRSSPGWAAHRIHDDETDIAIDTTGHTATNCLPIMAQRPAPVQAHYLGYGMTSGADFIDYLITDAVFMPPEMARYCTEKLVHLPHTFLATVRAPIQETAVRREEFGLPADGFVFCNFGRPNKLEPTVFAAWMRILRAVEGAVLWLGDWVPPTQRNLRREAAAEGVDPERLIFSGIVSHPLHLKRLALADLALDTFHHGGGVTTVDSLWAGLPVLTLAGETPPSRLGTTLLSAAEMPELITRRGEDYEALAVSLATNADRARSLRGRLWRQRLTCPLFDTDRYVRHLEHGLSLMWESHLRR